MLCFGVINAINGAEDWSLGSFAGDISGFSSCFKLVKFLYISRKFNEATYRPAKFSFESFEWYISFPVWPNEFSCFGFISF